MKKLKTSVNRLLPCLSALVMGAAVAGAGAQSWLRIHEPKVPAKLRKDKE